MIETDICIFYSEPDEEKVKTLAIILNDLGWRVWWSKDIKYGPWEEQIEEIVENTQCVITIWNKHAKRKGSITRTEAALAKDLSKPIITLVSENIKPPFPFNSHHIVADITNWELNDNANCIQDIIENLKHILGSIKVESQAKRLYKQKLFNKNVKLPCFVKSLSSHETQLSPDAGLIVLNLFPKMDAILVSAYDMYIDDNLSKEEREKKEETIKFMIDILNELDKKGTYILLDSGNYEKSRKNDFSWNEDKFKKVLASVPFTYAFCFDNLTPSINITDHVNDIISRIEGKYEDKLLPIIHAPYDEDEVRHYEQLPEIIYEYSKKKRSPVIAIPERELGEGMKEKVNTIVKIRAKLNTLGYYQPIHILGTGNPVSIVLLAAAGADYFDGLEWCRTVVDRTNATLSHHQQLEFFKFQTEDDGSYNWIKDAMKDSNLGYNLKMALHNVDFFDVWMEELQFTMEKGNVTYMLRNSLKFADQTFLKEIKKVLGLSK